MLLNSILVAVP